MEVMEDELVFNHEPANTLELEDGGDEDQIELVHRTPQTPRPQSQARAPTQHSAPAPRPRVPAFQDKTFEMFSNPTKRAPSEGEPDAFDEESPAQSVQVVFAIFVELFVTKPWCSFRSVLFKPSNSPFEHQRSFEYSVAPRDLQKQLSKSFLLPSCRPMIHLES